MEKPEPRKSFSSKEDLVNYMNDTKRFLLDKLCNAFLKEDGLKSIHASTERMKKLNAEGKLDDTYEEICESDVDKKQENFNKKFDEA